MTISASAGFPRIGEAIVTSTLCRAHNAYLAELDYGKEVMEKYRRGGDRVSESGTGYFGRVPLAFNGFRDAMRTSDA